MKSYFFEQFPKTRAIESNSRNYYVIYTRTLIQQRRSHKFHHNQFIINHCKWYRKRPPWFHGNSRCRTDNHVIYGNTYRINIHTRSCSIHKRDLVGSFICKDRLLNKWIGLQNDTLFSAWKRKSKIETIYTIYQSGSQLIQDVSTTDPRKRLFLNLCKIIVVRKRASRKNGKFKILIFL